MKIKKDKNIIIKMGKAIAKCTRQAVYLYVVNRYEKRKRMCIEETLFGKVSLI